MSTGTTARHVLPWTSMTPEQQADHLVHGHGYDADYYDRQGLTNAEVAERFITETQPSKLDENYPWPATGAFLHQSDHDEGTIATWVGLNHDHSKAL